ncbi:MAG: hypothetical protein COT33_01105 [Candidatus Nealsonbacteria bacterium CG08_land_8_20_14_0_20_38_20]|uniref:Uncharacterized protein n=1 Tax=Candidatus Nealsonbacteria bacterium CG08_land_8_20_14_0_20_38_20 TaxID=1974705 RepID=A0A2H0YM74_9BACT|nr:MAG: hypothetical protein COT33_01105 [Candidatus Nealsonbacteria bacterium CG08_land_8_20_14_0_20_38_20]
MPFEESKIGGKIEKIQPAPKEIKDEKTAQEKALEALTEKIYARIKEVVGKEFQEKREKNLELLRKESFKKEDKYPVDELRESAKKYDFDEVLISEEVPKIASAFPGKILFFPEKYFSPLRKIKEFAPDFAKEGMDSVFSHQSQFLKGGAFEMGKELYKKTEEYFLITESIKAVPRLSDKMRARGIFLDKEVLKEIGREEKEKLRKMDEEMKRLNEKREIKVFEQDKLSAGSEEEAVDKIANLYVFLELMDDYRKDNDNIESILRRESLTLLSSPSKEEENFGEKLISKTKKIKSELRKKYEESKTGSMYG